MQSGFLDRRQGTAAVPRFGSIFNCYVVSAMRGKAGQSSVISHQSLSISHQSCVEVEVEKSSALNARTGVLVQYGRKMRRSITPWLGLTFQAVKRTHRTTGIFQASSLRKRPSLIAKLREKKTTSSKPPHRFPSSNLLLG